mgnify:CR=1 FL=1
MECQKRKYHRPTYNKKTTKIAQILSLTSMIAGLGSSVNGSSLSIIHLRNEQLLRKQTNLILSYLVNPWRENYKPNQMHHKILNSIESIYIILLLILLLRFHFIYNFINPFEQKRTKEYLPM